MPTTATLKPDGLYTAVEVDRAGEISLLLPLALLEGGLFDYVRSTCSEMACFMEPRQPGNKRLGSTSEPLKPTSSLVILKANLTQGGDVFKTADSNLKALLAWPKYHYCEEDGIAAVYCEKIKAGDVVTIYYKDPKGRVGHSRDPRSYGCVGGGGMTSLRPFALFGQWPLLQCYPRVFPVGHVAFEAFIGSMMAFVEKNDPIMIGVEARKIEVQNPSPKPSSQAYQR